MKKLAWITVAFTYFLMVWGNLVSSTGSGLGCPDWPLCHGTVTPPLSFAVFFEWGHRLIAFVATVLIVTTLYKVFRAPASGNAALKKSGKSLLVLMGSLMGLVLVQILLGGTTVLLGLSIAVSTIHLIVAHLVLAGLITVAAVVTWGNPLVERRSPKITRLALAGLAAMLVQLTLGALVRHGHAGLACPAFPKCLTGFWPIPLTFETGVAFAHRWWGFLLLGVFVHLAFAAPKLSPKLAFVARASLGLAIIQIILGVMTVLSGLDTHARATHAAVGYALWAALFYIALRSGGVNWAWSGKTQGAKPAHRKGKKAAVAAASR